MASRVGNLRINPTHMPKPLDKYPELDPSVRGIFPRIIEAVAEMRKVQRSNPYIEKLRKEEQERGDRQKMRERESTKEEQRKQDEIWTARIRALPSFGKG